MTHDHGKMGLNDLTSNRYDVVSSTNEVPDSAGAMAKVEYGPVP